MYIWPMPFVGSHANILPLTLPVDAVVLPMESGHSNLYSYSTSGMLADLSKTSYLMVSTLKRLDKWVLCEAGWNKLSFER